MQKMAIKQQKRLETIIFLVSNYAFNIPSTADLDMSLNTPIEKLNTPEDS